MCTQNPALKKIPTTLDFRPTEEETSKQNSSYIFLLSFTPKFISMANIDPHTGYSATTKTYHSTRPPLLLPPESLSLSLPDYVFSSFCVATTVTPVTNQAAFIDAATNTSLSYPEFLRQFQSLSSSLQSNPRLSKGNVAVIISPPSLHIPVLYFSLLSLGVVVSPANPVSSESELSHIIRLSKPTIVFTTSAIAHKIPSHLPVIILDSPEFESMLTQSFTGSTIDRVVAQSDTAAILYSSGTTGRVKGVELSHRNLISIMLGTRRSGTAMVVEEVVPKVTLFTVPLFHVFGFFMALRAVAEAQTVVLMSGAGMRFDFEGMLRAVEKYKVRYMPVSPPLVVGMLNSEVTGKYDLSSLDVLGCGGAALGEDVARRFEKKFPNIKIAQGYGLTETAGGIVRTVDEEEMKHYGSAGRLSELVEAKIVDPSNGESLPPNQRGELWVRGPSIMKGYVGDESATSSTLTSDGWLKTGDLCYFDSLGYLYIVDRLKELIKYKAYQVPPAELETVLLSHPEIADTAVIAYPDEEAGEIPVAFVVRKPGSKITSDEIMAFVSKQVAPYKKVRKVFFTQAIPKSPAGKILRRELTSQAVRTTTSAKL